MKDKIIAKQDEYIKYLLKGILYFGALRNITQVKRDEFESKIAQLKAEADVTDADIEKWAEEYSIGVYVNRICQQDIMDIAIEGAKAMRDNLIKKG